ncbi:MAG: hypothetical protein Q8O52_17945 [Sulfuritalea sp.]|nr:hypothetical protein [Sulfuritalea sp.]
MSGTEFLSRVKEMHPDTIRIVLTGYTDLQSVTDAVNGGAIYKFLTKPWDDALLREHIRRLYSLRGAERQAINGGSHVSGIAACSTAKKARNFAESDRIRDELK